jgi:hypothetical protein
MNDLGFKSSSSPAKERPPTLFQTVVSVLAAFFGVQSAKNRERDFRQGRAGVFIGVGAALTVLFVLTVWLVVKLVLAHAGM